MDNTLFNESPPDTNQFKNRIAVSVPILMGDRIERYKKLPKEVD